MKKHKFKIISSAVVVFTILFGITIINYNSVESINERITAEKIAINQEIQLEFGKLILKNKAILDKDIELENLKAEKKEIQKLIKGFQDELVTLNGKQEFNAESFEYVEDEEKIFFDDIISDEELRAIDEGIKNIN